MLHLAHRQVDADHRGLEGRTAYAKRFKDFSMLVVSDSETDSVEDVFMTVPKKSRMQSRLHPPGCGLLA